MCYTNEPVPGHVSTQETLQIFCVKIKQVKGGLQWPLHVYGIVAARDPIDRNRNIIFNRTRDNCQVLTEEVASFLLSNLLYALLLPNKILALYCLFLWLKKYYIVATSIVSPCQMILGHLVLSMITFCEL